MDRISIIAAEAEMPRIEFHPNRAQFKGLLTLVNVPSDGPPKGSWRHRVMLTDDAVKRVLPTIIGMGINYTPHLDRHNPKNKVGIITKAEMYYQMSGDRCQIEVGGHIFARDFPEVMKDMRLKAGQLGMSYEIAEARVESVIDEIWKITDFVFAGAAILKRSLAAYQDTWISLIEERA